MGEKYSALLVEGMLQRIRNLQRAIAMKEDRIRAMEDQIDKERGCAAEYRGRLVDFEHECEAKQVGCFGCSHLRKSANTLGFYVCEITDEGVDIHSAFSGCSEWEGKTNE